MLFERAQSVSNSGRDKELELLAKLKREQEDSDNDEEKIKNKEQDILNLGERYKKEGEGRGRSLRFLAVFKTEETRWSALEVVFGGRIAIFGERNKGRSTNCDQVEIANHLTFHKHSTLPKARFVIVVLKFCFLM